MGAILALERIAHDSESDYWATIELLASFVRERAQIDATERTVPDADVQAALTAIGRRSASRSKRRVDLRRTDLRGARFLDGYYPDILFDGALLDGATFEHCFLTKASFNSASINGVQLRRSVLEYADFGKAAGRIQLLESRAYGSTFAFASPIGSTFLRSDLERATFQFADLSSALFAESRFENALLWETTARSLQARSTSMRKIQIQGSDIREANLQNVNLESATFHGVDLGCAILDGAILSDAWIWGSCFLDTTLHGAFLGGTRFSETAQLTIGQLTDVYIGRDTELPIFAEACRQWPYGQRGAIDLTPLRSPIEFEDMDAALKDPLQGFPSGTL